MPYKNIEDSKAHNKKYYIANKEKFLSDAKKYIEVKKLDPNFKEYRNSICRKSYYKNKDKVSVKRKIKYRSTFKHLKKYGISVEDYNNIYEGQGRACVICGSNNSKSNRAMLLPLCVDHCHKTNRVRGLLCSNCNIMIGLAEDNTIVLQNAIDYLRRYNG